jgi:hypothetical protein
MRRLLAGVLATAALGAAPPARAEPVALRDAPRAQDLALAGDSVVLGRAAGNAVRVDALPLAGGSARRLLTVHAPNAAYEAAVEVAASADLVVAVVNLDRPMRVLVVPSRP